MLKFDASIFGGELPVGLGVVGIAVLLPGGDFVDEDLFVGNAAIEALGRQDAEFRLGQIEPAAVFWSVVPFEALDQAPGFDGRKGFVECSLAVDAEIVLDQNDGLGVREVDVGQVFQDASVIHGGMTICDVDVAPAFERSKHHEEIGGAIALVLVIETGRASRFHRDWHARFGNELLRGLVEANQRTIAIAWPRVDGQHVFHSGYERAVGLRRDDPVLAAMGLKSVFLSARPIVLSLARSTMPSSTTLFSNNRKVQRARPLGGLEQAKAITWPPSRRQKSDQRQASRAACGSTRLRSLLPPVVCALLAQEKTLAH